MDRVGGIHSHSDRHGRGPGSPPRPPPALEEAPPAEPVRPRPDAHRQRALLLTSALRRLDRIQALTLSAAARSTMTGSAPLDDDVAALLRPIRLLLRTLERSCSPTLLGETLRLLEELGLKASEALKTGEVSVSSLPRLEQVEPLLHRLGTARGREDATDVLSRGFRNLRGSVADVLAELPPVLDVQA